VHERGSLSQVSVALAASAFLLAWGALHWGFYAHDPLKDTPLYERYGDRIVSGEVPYRDFRVEYPPAALPVFVLPSLAAGAHDFRAYARVFEALMGALGVACAVLVALILARRKTPPRRLALGIALVGLGPLALGPVLLSRFDLWPAALTAAALAALAFERPRLSFALLGVAVAAKLYALALIPLALLYIARRRGRREALVGAGVALAVMGVLVLPFVALSPNGVWASISGQATRPLQIESLGSAVLLAAHQAFGVPVTVASSHGSDNLVGSSPHALAVELAVLQTAAVAAVVAGFAKSRRDLDGLLRSSAAAVCAFVALGKVLSPQFLGWLLPLVALVRGRRGVVAAALLAAAMVLTQLWFPYRYVRLVYSLDPVASWLVLGRDLVLLALLAVLAWPAARQTRTEVAGAGAPAASSSRSRSSLSPAIFMPCRLRSTKSR
jgi:Glycosyltransferase family 87